MRRPTIIFGLLTYGTISMAFAAMLQLGMADRLATANVLFRLLLIRLLYAVLEADIQLATVALILFSKQKYSL
ncbi:MAG: hypothetical protein OXE78_00025 [Gammaproteobacteria bacterium]|nr:hypothetical protein [Gammaproteobacteria bacterium]MCY4356199.1 hypothetical protein [Gammaproteobacteria bacterium]